MKRILMGGPLRQDPRIFREHLKSLDALDTSDLEVDRFWILNDCDELKPLLEDGEYVVHNTGDIYTTTEITHLWTYENLAKMSILRNMMIKRALEGGYDYLLFIDSDLILQPQTLQVLIATGKDLVSEIFWTQAEPDKPWIWANSWDYDQSTVLPESYQAYSNPGLYKVGGTGACFLISRAVLEAGANYSPIYCIKHALKGEDRHFCIRAICLGFDIWTDTHVPATHLYRESEYFRYMEDKYGSDYSAGKSEGLGENN